MFNEWWGGEKGMKKNIPQRVTQWNLVWTVARCPETVSTYMLPVKLHSRAVLSLSGFRTDSSIIYPFKRILSSFIVTGMHSGFSVNHWNVCHKGSWSSSLTFCHIFYLEI